MASLSLLLPLSSARGQPSFPGRQEDLGFNVRVYPSDFWGPRIGPGVGVGLVGHNVVRRDDQWLVTAAPALHEQAATLSFASAYPRRAQRYVLVDARAMHSDRDWIGPWSLDRSSIRGRIRIGRSFFDRRLLVQPHVSLVSSEVADVAVRDELRPAPEQPTPSSPGAPQQTAQTGLRIGLDVRYDTRTRPASPLSGILFQGTWDQYVPLDGSDLHFDQVDVDAHGYLPVGGLHRIALHASLTLTSPLSDTSVPPYMLPVLGGTVVPGWARARFVGRDRLMGRLLYRFPLWSLSGLAGIEGHVGTHLANVYQNLEHQFIPTIRFDDPTLPEGKRPLLPTASTGLRFVAPARPWTTLDLALGVSPEGVVAARVSFVRRLQSVRLPHHSSDPLR